MSLFEKKCSYCKSKIEKNKKIERNVKVPGFIGTRKKTFCCKGHADKYEKEVEECMKKPMVKGSCCG